MKLRTALQIMFLTLFGLTACVGHTPNDNEYVIPTATPTPLPSLPPTEEATSLEQDLLQTEPIDENETLYNKEDWEFFSYEDLGIGNDVCRYKPIGFQENKLSDNILWFLTGNGLASYNHEILKKYWGLPNEEIERSPSLNIERIVESPGYIWFFCSCYPGLIRFELTSESYETVIPQVSNERFTDFEVIENAKILVVVMQHPTPSEGISYLDEIDLTTGEKTREEIIEEIRFVDYQDQTIFLFGWKDIAWKENDEWIIQNIKDDFGSGGVVFDVYTENANSIWLLLRGGDNSELIHLKKAQGKYSVNLRYPISKINPAFSPLILIPGGESDIWFGGLDPELIGRYDINTNTMETIDGRTMFSETSSVVPFDYVSRLYYASDGFLWVSSDLGLYRYKVD